MKCLHVRHTHTHSQIHIYTHKLKMMTRKNRPRYVYKQEMETVNELEQWKNDEIMEFSPLYLVCTRVSYAIYNSFSLSFSFNLNSSTPPKMHVYSFQFGTHIDDDVLWMAFISVLKIKISLLWTHTTVSYTSIQLTLPCSFIKLNSNGMSGNIRLCSILSRYSSKIHKGII